MLSAVQRMGSIGGVNWRGHADVLVHFMQLHGVEYISILCHF